MGNFHFNLSTFNFLLNGLLSTSIQHLVSVLNQKTRPSQKHTYVILNQAMFVSIVLNFFAWKSASYHIILF